jgi:hypothetical protein
MTVKFPSNLYIHEEKSSLDFKIEQYYARTLFLNKNLVTCLQLHMPVLNIK